jgi:hypothetical protein
MIATRNEVLRFFQSHRAAPETPFDEAHFLDFLLAQPKSKRAVYNSFSGLRRYNAFIDSIQLHFGICFSLADFDANYSLEKFVHRIAQLQSSRRSSLASLHNQRRHGFGSGTVFVLNLLALGLIALVSGFSIQAAVALLVFAILANGLVIRFYLQWRSYRTRLANRLQGIAQ